MIFKFSLGLMMLDFFLCVIWLPIGVSRTYGFRPAKDVFTMTCTSYLELDDSRIFTSGLLDNGTGAPAGWNWILSLYVNPSALRRQPNILLQPFHGRNHDGF